MPDQKPEEDEDIVFMYGSSPITGYYKKNDDTYVEHIGGETFCDNEVGRWAYVADIVTQADKAERLQKRLDTGDLSDGYHTFNELYYHRMCLFSIIVKQHKYLAWKSKLHSDGTMFDNYFIVGIETPNGQATYHYHIDHWDMFDCVELPNAPEYDRHTPDDCLERLLTLKTKETTNNKKKGE